MAESLEDANCSPLAVAEAVLFDYIEPVGNRMRRHSALGYALPIEFREERICVQHQQQLAA